MLTLKDCADFCDLNFDDLMAIEEFAHLSPVEACAYIEELSATPRGCRQLLEMMQEHVERVEKGSNNERVREAHEALNHFAATHHFV